MKKTVSNRMRRTLRRSTFCRCLAAGALALAVCGCGSAGYYGQAVMGQARIMLSQRPIAELLGDPAAPAELKEKLAYVMALRAFAESELLLPVGRSYLAYADIGRPYVVWNVFAAPELSLAPKTWCYPIVGCAVYRGYFSEEQAERYAEELRREGQDTFVSGALAYSTLGWFEDPVLSSVLRLDRARLAALLFHELAHRVLYVSGDTTFNESFATAVEAEGVRRWAAAAGDPGLVMDYDLRQREQEEFVAIVKRCRRELEALYAGALPPERKRVMKAAVISGLLADFGSAKRQLPGMARYDGWFAEGINNAALAAVSAYHDWVPAFERLLAESSGDLASFYDHCIRLTRMPAHERSRRMETLMGHSLPQSARDVPTVPATAADPATAS
jgi:predicted aminopeptidase